MNKLVPILVFLIWQTSQALQAPFLYSADSASDSTVLLTWRNNSTAYQGVIVLRKSGLSSQYNVLDTASGTSTSFVDTIRGQSRMILYYELTAFSQTEHADTSNADSAFITPPPPISSFLSPFWLKDSSASGGKGFYISFLDSSTIENGYRIFRITNLGAPLLVKDTPSVTPSSIGPISWYDSFSAQPNTWYSYIAESYLGNDTKSCTSSVFTFNKDSMTQQLKAAASRQWTVGTKLSSFPIRYRSWSLKAGDTIVLNEKGMPVDSMFSIINVSDPENPTYAGTGTSFAARIDSNYVTTKGHLILGTWVDTLYVLNYSSGKIIVKSSASGVPPYDPTFGPCFLNDSAVLIAGSYLINFGTSTTGHSCTEYPYKNGSVSSGKQIAILPPTTFYDGGGFVSGETQSLFGPMIWNNRFLLNSIHHIYGGSGIKGDTETIIVDFNFASTPVYDVAHSLVQPPFIIDGVLIKDTTLVNLSNVIIDTAKNLIFAFSDTNMSIYTSQTAGAVSTSKVSPKPDIFQAAAIHLTRDLSVFTIPSHSSPATIRIYSLSGRLVNCFKHVEGRTVLWKHDGLSGLYLVSVLADGRMCTMTTILAR